MALHLGARQGGGLTALAEVPPGRSAAEWLRARGACEGGGMMDKARWLLLLGYALAVLALWIIGANT